MEDIQSRIDRQRRKNKRLRKKWEQDRKTYEVEYQQAIIDLHNLHGYGV